MVGRVMAKVWSSVRGKSNLEHGRNRGQVFEVQVVWDLGTGMNHKAVGNLNEVDMQWWCLEMQIQSVEVAINVYLKVYSLKLDLTLSHPQSIATYT